MTAEGRFAVADFFTPEDAYSAFFESFNRQDPAAWARVMSYPHVRASSAGVGPISANEAEYAGRASWENPQAMGWVRTQGIEPVRVHESPTKVHVTGGWTRYNASDEPILTNRVTYILTRIDGGWGIQARFGLDSYVPGEDFSETERAATAAVYDVAKAVASGDREAYESAFHLPFVVVDVGKVERVEAPPDDIFAMLTPPAGSGLIVNVEALQVGRTGANLAVDLRGPDARRRGIVLVTEREGRWAIQALSMLRET